MDTYIKQFDETSEILLNYGWFLSPYMIGADFEEIYKYAINIKEHPPKTENEKLKVSQSINSLFTHILFHPNYRAFFVFRSKTLKHISQFSHHLERSVFHYYKQDYFSCVLCLIPAIEGILLSYYGWTFGDPKKPSYEDIINFIENNSKKVNMVEYYITYKKVLIKFLREWIYKPTKYADTSISFLNRHYISHGMGNQSYYSVDDCHKLLLLFDLLIEVLSFEENIFFTFIPNKEKNLNIRRDYYFDLLQNKLPLNLIVKIENKFMIENDGFIAEKKPLNFIEIFNYLIKRNEEIIKKYKK